MFIESKDNSIELNIMSVIKVDGEFWCLSRNMLFLWDYYNNLIKEKLIINNKEWMRSTRRELVCVGEKIYCFCVKSHNVIVYNKNTKVMNSIIYEGSNCYNDNDTFASVCVSGKYIWILPRTINVPLARINTSSDSIEYFDEWNDNLKCTITELEQKQILFNRFSVIKNNVLWGVMYKDRYIVKTDLQNFDTSVLEFPKGTQLWSLADVDNLIYCSVHNKCCFFKLEGNSIVEHSLHFCFGIIMVNNSSLISINTIDRKVCILKKNSIEWKMINNIYEKDDIYFTSYIDDNELIICTDKEMIRIFLFDYSIKRTNLNFGMNDIWDNKEIINDNIGFVKNARCIDYLEYVADNNIVCLGETDNYNCGKQIYEHT